MGHVPYHRPIGDKAVVRTTGLLMGLGRASLAQEPMKLGERVGVAG